MDRLNPRIQRGYGLNHSLLRRSVMMRVDERMPAPPTVAPPIDRKGGDEGGQEGQEETYPEQTRRWAGLHRAGMTRMTALSTISMTVIESVSEANASRSDVWKASPPARSGRRASAYPKTKARTTARATEAMFPHPSRVPMTRPNTSPMEQPVRQCTVAETAMRLSVARESGA